MATQVTVSGTLKDAEGNNLSGTVTFRPSSPFYDSDGNMIVGTAPVDATLSSGTFSVVLYATDDTNTTASDATYKVSEDLTGSDGNPIKRKYKAEVPSASATLRYEDMVEVEAQPRYSYATTASVAAAITAEGPGRLTSAWSAYGHSFGKLGASDDAHLFTRLVADGCHAQLSDYHASGTDLVDRGNANTTQGGHIRILGTDAPSSSYNKQSYVGRRGVASITHGINDIQDYGSDANWSQLVTCFEHCLRASISWLQLATFHLHSQASTGQTFGGSGSWSTGTWTSGFEEGPGASRYTNSSSGATYTLVTGANAAGHTVAIFLPTNYTGGSRNASTITATLDGVATTPTGWDSLDLSAVGLSDMGHGVCAVARFDLPDDGAQHTIVLTAGTGGMSVAGYGIESTVPRPVLVANVALRSDAGYTPNGSAAKVVLLNTAISGVVAEFGSPVVVVDIYTPLGTTTGYFSDGLHPNDKGHQLIATAYRSALDSISTLVAASKAVL